MQGTRSLIDFWLKSQSNSDPALRDNGFGAFDILGGFMEIFTFLICLNILITIIRCSFYAAYNLLSARNIFRKLMEKIMLSKLKFFDTNTPGRILNRVTSDTFEIDDKLPWYIHTFFESLAKVAVFPIVIIIQFPLSAIGKLL